MACNIAYDLDGTLILTRQANLRAYRVVGADPPEDFHTRPWQTWTTKGVHDAKNSIVDKFLREMAVATPLLGIYTQTGGSILTNASETVVEVLRGMFPGLYGARIYRMTPDEKLDWMRARDPGFYFDDNVELIARVNRETRWTAAWVRFE